MERFLRVANYFGRLIPNFSSKIKPLNALRQPDTPFCWTSKCANSFAMLKKEISSYPVLPYSLDKASKDALAACLTQEGHPVIFVSRVLSKAEQNYSNIELEALAVTWAILRLKHFLSGRPFLICTDHQPLRYLFSCNTSIPSGTSARICHWTLALMITKSNMSKVKIFMLMLCCAYVLRMVILMLTIAAMRRRKLLIPCHLLIIY